MTKSKNKTEEIKNLYLNGASVSEIADKYSVSKQAIYRHIRKFKKQDAENSERVLQQLIAENSKLKSELLEARNDINTLNQTIEQILYDLNHKNDYCLRLFEAKEFLDEDLYCTKRIKK